jgi:hypothetical protein
VKVSELEGRMLDYWVARGLGWTHEKANRDTLRIPTEIRPFAFYPSQRWSDGGPIIDRERICFQETHEYNASWHIPRRNKVWAFPHTNIYAGAPGATRLEASMRCFVASKFGEEVPD